MPILINPASPLLKQLIQAKRRETGAERQKVKALNPLLSENHLKSAIFPSADVAS